MTEEIVEEEIIAPMQFGRVKGASWFPLLHKQTVLVLGQGGIGSWLSLLVARAGANLYICDMDNYEEHNLTGQMAVKSSIGKNKAVATSELLRELSPETSVSVGTNAYSGEFTNEIVLCGFDNMAARKTAFESWKEFVFGTKEEDRKHCFFQDGRLLAEQMQVLNIPGDREDLMEKYEKEYLFSDEEVTAEACSFKQTSHSAAMIASHMTGFLTNWISNAHGKGPKRTVPFYWEYLIPFNYTDNA